MLCSCEASNSEASNSGGIPLSTTLARQTVEEQPMPSVVALRSAYDLSSRLMDSLLHDVRNPLNALAINIEVFSEKLKSAGDGLAQTFERNLKSMKEQVLRADNVLRRFADFVAPSFHNSGQIEVSNAVERAADVLSYEARRHRVRFQLSLESGLLADVTHLGALRLAILQLLHCAMLGTAGGEQIEVRTSREGARAVVAVRWPAGEGSQESSGGMQGLEAVCQQGGFRISVEKGVAQLSLQVR
jgi:signal transduction histidine kinase